VRKGLFETFMNNRGKSFYYQQLKHPKINEKVKTPSAPSTSYVELTKH